PHDPAEGREIGLFGGSFDPPTNAHLFAAEYARAALSLDEVWLVLARQNPLKAGRTFTPPEIRREMLAAALEGHDRLRLEGCELDRPGPSYTYDTVVHLRRMHPGVRFLLLLGMDAVLTLPRWYRAEELRELVEIVVLTRPGVELSRLDRSWLEKVRLLDMPLQESSSTEVRRRVRAGLPVTGLVPPGVAAIIDREKLYRSGQGG
ncbi:MAG TPA: nicotinate (nicotinamide) nucleotide adenylyltransferase, partial [Bacteroidetes bacterium]|nr:nicotinate (nicotinamide) nucleotide adenylyltransferase [Bacteroidota bacterium]